MRHAAVTLAAAAACFVPTLLAQSEKVPKRPRLVAGADTSSARDYYDHGVALIERRPNESANAFYWAARLDPAWAEPLYARRIALLMADPHLLVRYMSGARGVLESREVRRIDSLELRALTLNPFVLRDLDRPFIVRYLSALYEDALSRRGRQLGAVDRLELEYWIQSYLTSDATIRTKAWLAASERRFPEALLLYGQALRDGHDAASIHMDRGRLFYVIGNYDSARVEMDQALAELRQRDEQEFTYLYESKALLEHSVGMILERKGDLAGAREAYGRALAEDLSFHAAHLRLGLLALAEGDTVAAVNELELAVQIKEDDPWLRVTFAVALAQTGRAAQAVPHIRKAIELEPYYALPYYLLGRMAESADDRAQATAFYQGFLARASQRDPRRADVARRVAALSARPQ